ncbi:unnamed protein product, partial [Ceratitis capitata]
NQISWIRRRDWHILSSGAQLYTNDERFAILHAPGSNMWTLQINLCNGAIMACTSVR